MERPEFKIRKCRACATMWCDPLRFEQAFHPDDEDAYLKVDQSVRKENAGRLQMTREHAPPSRYPHLLEIGCMHGDFVQQAADAGYDATGLDLSETAVKWAQRHRPGLVRLGTLGPDQRAASIDVVAAFNVVEHMDDPGAFLDQVQRVLRPGGVLVVETPAQESLYHVALVGPRVRAPSPSDVWKSACTPERTSSSSDAKAWRNVLRRRGFEVLDLRSKSTPLQELLAKTREQSAILRGSVVGFGLAARITGLGNRVLLASRRA